MYRAPRGTSDILPGEQPYWDFIRGKAADMCRLYGYGAIETPVFEDTGLFVRGVGQGTDIVEKEMYTFIDKGENSITLRPEGTAPVCRAYLEHGLQNQPQPVKLFYFASIFRYERPQAGRLRQHHQFGCEAIGDADPALDAETIDMAWQFFLSLGLSRLSLQLNSIGCKQCRPAYISLLKQYYAASAEKLCADCKTRYERNPLRLLDCKEPACQAAADAAPKSMDHLCPECAAHFAKLKECLGLIEIPFNLNHRLVRGLDYYTRTVFEIQPETGGAMSTIGGGGRYDNLIEELGGKPTPAIGFATGMERIILNLKRQGVAVPPTAQPKLYIAFLGEEAGKEALRLTAQLRRKGLGVLVSTGSRSLKAQLRQANSAGARQAIIIGEQELQTGSVILRDMVNAEQKSVALADLITLLENAA